MSKKNGKQPKNQMTAKVFFSIMLSRGLADRQVIPLIRVAVNCGRRGFAFLRIPYGRIDTSRNLAIMGFKKFSTSPYDTLVLLDDDHDYPYDIVESLAFTDPAKYGVIAPKVFVRSDDYHPMFAELSDQGYLITPKSWPENTIAPYGFVPPACMAVRRWVFDKIDELVPGLYGHYFKAQYPQGLQPFEDPTEDDWFGKLCRKAGIKMWVNTALEAPHLRWETVKEEDWLAYAAAHPEEFVEEKDVKPRNENRADYDLKEIEVFFDEAKP